MMSIDDMVLDESIVTWMTEMVHAKGIRYDDLGWYDSDDNQLLQLIAPSIDTIASQWVLCAVTPRDEPPPRRFDMFAVVTANDAIPVSFQLAALAEKTLPRRMKVTTKTYGVPEVLRLSTPLREDYIHLAIMMDGLEVMDIEMWEDGELTTSSTLLTTWSQDILRKMLLALFEREVNDTVS